MTSKKCPKCNLTNFPDAETCKRCGSNLTEHQPDEPAAIQSRIEIPNAPTVSQPRTQSAGIVIGNIINIIVWVIMVLYSLGASASLHVDLGQAQSAPQQAAVGAMIAAQMIIAYCLARAVTQIVRTAQGK